VYCECSYIAAVCINSYCVDGVIETAEGQYAQAEEHGNKLKQLLLKTKKDLADAKKLVIFVYSCRLQHVIGLHIFMCLVCVVLCVIVLFRDDMHETSGIDLEMVGR